MDYRPNACRQFHRVAERVRRVQAVCRWHRALGCGSGRQLFRAWQDYRSLSRAVAARSHDADTGIKAGAAIAIKPSGAVVIRPPTKFAIMPVAAWAEAQR